MQGFRTFSTRFRAPLAIYLVCASVYVAMLGARRFEHTPDDHFAHLAQSFLHGRLDQGGDPPGTNDWACYDRVEHGACPNGVFRFPPELADRYRWYVSFPPVPAVVMMPAVAAFGVDLPDRLFWALVAGLGPMSVFLLLRRARELGVSGRSAEDDLLLTFLFAFGSVFFFVAVQGTVWFAAHVTLVPLLSLFLAASLGARRPIVAGLALGLCFLTRPSTCVFAFFFLAEALRVSRAAKSDESPEDELGPLDRLVRFLRPVSLREALPKLALFALPCLVAIGLAMAMNRARFEDPFEFGHEYLQIVWRTRIEKWGLFNYHYVGKNLAIFLAGLPWLSRNAPHVVISAHGLALWVTTPAVLFVLFPKRVTPEMRALGLAVLFAAVFDLMYQNSGWIQFGYRFALDYFPGLILLLALGGRRFDATFRVLAAYALVVNTYGAVTFDRVPSAYFVDGRQDVFFQPDGS